MTDSTQQTQPAARRDSSLADILESTSAASARTNAGWALWGKVAVLGGLFAWLNWWQFRRLISVWRDDVNWSHGFMIPLFSLYLLYSRREELLAAPRRVCLLGLPIFIGGVLMSLLGFYPISNTWLSQLSMVITLFGLVLYLAGPGVMRYAWLPILYLALAMPIPTILYTRIATPLQNLAAVVSTNIMMMLNVQVEVSASNIKLLSHSGQEYSVTVAEACSGMRSLLAFVALGVAWAYLEARPLWQRVVLVLSAVPVAVLLNIVRVTITGWMYVIDRPELGQKFMHEFMGMMMLAPALAIFWGLSYCLRHLFVEVDEDDDPAPPAQAKERA